MQHRPEDELIDAVSRSPLRPFLEEGTRLRLRDYGCYELLRDEWGLPVELAGCGALLPWIERGLIAPAAVATRLGPLAGEIAAAAQLVAAAEPRSDQGEVAPQWRLFLLARLAPEGAALAIGALLARLRDTERGHSADQLLCAANVAARLGMYEVRRELLDRRAMLVDFARYRRLRARLEESAPARASFAATLAEDLSRRLEDAGIAPRLLRHRPVHVHQMAEEQLDSSWGEFVGADRVDLLVADVPACYSALGVINVAYTVNGSRLRDYIGGPKDTGYQALHTSIFFPDNERLRLLPVELFICTEAMDVLNRRGIVAAMAGEAEAPSRGRWWSDEVQRESMRAAMAGDAESMFVFTPRGEPIFLPRGATVLDFAVRVHSDLGVYCRGALVNGRRTLPGQQLACGDICEVLIDQHNVQIDSAMLRRTTTSYARAKVRRALQRGVSGADRGREIFRKTLERRLNGLGLRTRAQLVEQLLQRFCAEQAYERPEAFYQAVARGEAAPDEAIGTVIEHLLKPRLAFDELPTEVASRIVSLHLGHCCWPAPGAEALAILVEKKGTLRARVHRAACPALARYSHHDEVGRYPVSWLPERERGYVADLLYEGRDELGLIFQITRDINDLLTLNITRMEASLPEPRMARLLFTCEAADQQQLEKLARLLRARPGQRRVECTIRPLHDDALTIDEPLTNPYSPQPSATYPLFVGREAEIRRILALVGGPMGDSHTLIRGPKRIGKSSLLQNLSLYHLRDLRRQPLLNLQHVANEEMPIWRLLDRIAGMLLEGGRARPGVLDAARLRHDPIETFAEFVGGLRARGGPERFAVLLDEFGVIETRFAGVEREEQLQMWRGLLSDERVRRHLSFIIAAPDGSAPGVGEICPVVRLEVLRDEEARDLINTPVHAHLDYRPHDVNKIMAASGAHPYYIQLVCGEVVSQLIWRRARTGAPATRQVVPTELVDAAIARVGANDDAFHHVTADDELTVRVLVALARATGPDGRGLPLARLQQMLPGLSPAQLDRAVDQRRDLFVRTESQVAIRVGLVAARLRDRPPPALAHEVLR